MPCSCSITKLKLSLSAFIHVDIKQLTLSVCLYVSLPETPRDCLVEEGKKEIGATYWYREVIMSPKSWLMID